MSLRSLSLIFLVAATVFSSVVRAHEAPLVSIDDLGQLRGRLESSAGTGRQFAAFHRVPYARPPLGALRFRRPDPRVQPWSGVLDASEPAPLCAQLFLGQYRGEEDCLYLNVYTPAPVQQSPGQPLPVMVFIPGGAFNFGSGGPEENGPGWLLDHDVVLVTFNYRVGPFGFLTTEDSAAPGNYGLYDQLAALRWVQQHIAAFGGDPTQVTLFGESAGAVSVHLHMISPMSRSLFQRAISQSATALAFWTLGDRQLELAEQLAAAVDCPASGHSSSLQQHREMIDCLREQPAELLAVKQDPLYRQWSVYPLMFAFHPRVESVEEYVDADDAAVYGQSVFLPMSPRALIERGSFADVPWIVGFNQDEGGTFGSLHLVNDTALHVLRSEPDTAGPVWLGLRHRTPDPAAIYQQIVRFYFGQRLPGLASIAPFIAAEGDRFFATAVDAASRLHSRHGSAPVYRYVLEQTPAVPYPTLIARGAGNSELAAYPWRLAHKGELRFLFTGTEQPMSEHDSQFARVLSSLWFSFASGNLPPTTNLTTMPVWPRYSEADGARHMRLSQSPSVGSHAYAERMAFWQGLPLHEDGNLGYKLPSRPDVGQGSCPAEGACTGV